MRIVFALAAVVCLSLSPVTSAQDGLRVLFIGNSLTAMHNVPSLVEQLTEHSSPRVRAASVTRNNFSLEDHWNEGTAVRAITSGRWSFVVLQQGPSALPESRTLLRASVKQFDTVIRKAGARTALYMVWPAEARAGDFDGVRDSYALAAADVGGLFIPAGDAWRAAWRRDPAIELYAADRFHPTAQGSYLAALVIAQVLTGRAAETMPNRIAGMTDAQLPVARARLLQQAAADVIR